HRFPYTTLFRSPDVLRLDAKDASDPRGVLADPQLVIEVERADVGPIEQVLHVAIELRELLDLTLVLGVDGIELLVDRMELFVGALELLVRGDELLVGGLQLLVRSEEHTS